eukprot:CAMPEP_0178434956 /NCGR_PEP_ID=MMETSP0689_2-20121128/33684_1 /TAXON_ID=160604 /ORGANISM="Amphidinium massartii, Strain CS-259" /LENGTH=438 /DNA_ID=CAMNT_0020057023 /DNA_START=180 /DNA_END=1496 /DNA_ORIENTATION=-
MAAPQEPMSDEIAGGFKSTPGSEMSTLNAEWLGAQTPDITSMRTSCAESLHGPSANKIRKAPRVRQPKRPCPEEKLFWHMRQLEPEGRRMLCQTLGQEQKRSLERWMLAQKALQAQTEQAIWLEIQKGPISWNRWQHIKAASGCRTVLGKRSRQQEVAEWHAANEKWHGPQGRRRKRHYQVLAASGLHASPKTQRDAKARSSRIGCSLRKARRVCARLHFQHRKGVTMYRATCQAGPFELATRLCRCVHKAQLHLEVLQSIRQRMRREGSQDPAYANANAKHIVDIFRRILREELQRAGVDVVEDMGLSFRASVGAWHWIGCHLDTPCCTISSLSCTQPGADGNHLESSSWLRLRAVRDLLPPRGLASCSQQDLDNTWLQLQREFLDIWSKAGIPEERVRARLANLRSKHVSKQRTWPKSLHEEGHRLEKDARVMCGA